MPITSTTSAISSITLGKIIGMVLSRWWLVALTTGACLTTAYYVAKQTPLLYEATTVIEVRTKGRQILGNDVHADDLRVKEAVATVATKLKNPRLIAAILEQPEIRKANGFFPDDPTTEGNTSQSINDRPDLDEVQLQQMISSWISIQPQSNTSLVNITVKHQTPAITAIISDALAEKYIADDEKLKSGGIGGATKAVKEEMSKAAEDQDEAERRLQIYKTSLEMRTSLEEKRVELQQLRQRYKIKWPDRAAAEAVYSDLILRFVKAVTFAAKDPAEAEYWNDLPAPDFALGNSENQTELEDWAFLAQQRLKARESLLESKIKNLTFRYDALSKRLLEIDVSSKGDDAADVTIAQYAIPPDPRYPSSPQKKIILGVGAAAGIGIGSTLALLLGLANTKVSDVHSAESITGAKVLAAVQHSSKFKQKNGWRSVFEEHPQTIHAESFRNLRASIELLNGDRTSQSIAISSAREGEGKTTIAAELAVCCSQKWEKVLLVDGDLRRATLSTFFELPESQPGLTNYLAEEAAIDEVIFKTPYEGLDLLHAGTPTNIPSELINAASISRLTNELGARYDKIIIDTAPLLPVRDTLILSKFIDIVALVVRSGDTKAHSLSDVAKLFHEHDLTIDGLIMNSFKPKDSTRSYYGSQYSNYS